MLRQVKRLISSIRSRSKNSAFVGKIAEKTEEVVKSYSPWVAYAVRYVFKKGYRISRHKSWLLTHTHKTSLKKHFCFHCEENKPKAKRTDKI